MRFFFLCFFLITNLYLGAQSAYQLQLFDLPDVSFTPIETPEGYSSAYELRVKQPIDHKNPAKGYFYQRVFLSHKSATAPTVMVTEGYDRSRNRVYELTEMLGANQIMVEHRYTGASVPENMDWQYLNLEQATADLHHINELFRAIYPENWISTGISKGGQTTIYYRYFYPNDVDASVPYVAPMTQDFEDPRIYKFLASVGTKECRDALTAIQVRLLEERETVLPRLYWFAQGKGYTFDYLGFEQAFEYAVLEYPFSFWQSYGECNKVPAADVDIDTLLQHFIDQIGLGFYDDKSMVAYGPHYYQAATEMGYYGYETKPFKKWLKAINDKPHAAFVPNKMKVKYDPTLSRKVAKWVENEANEMIYIYGEIDTWSANAVDVSEKVDALKIVLPDKHHGNARIKNMSVENQRAVMKALEKWLAE